MAVSDLSMLLAKQEVFYKKVLPLLSSWYHSDDSRRTKNTLAFLACIHNELEELRQELPWKWWKFGKRYTSAVQVKEEIIDLFIFVIDLMLVWDMDAKDVYDRTMAKISINHERLEEELEKHGR